MVTSLAALARRSAALVLSPPLARNCVVAEQILGHHYFYNLKLFKTIRNCIRLDQLFMAVCN